MTVSDSANAPTLAAALWPSRLGGRTLRFVVLALLGTLLLTVSAKVQVPFRPVPMTMQTLVVLALGMAYGWRLGAATLLLYLAEGAVGLPVFAGTPERGIGLAYMAGPTGGYLVGFVAAAVTVGYLAERGWDRRPLSTAAAMVAGNVVIYVLGVAWLSIMIGFAKAIEFGVTPFLLGDALKVALGVALLPLSWRLATRFRS